MSPFLRFIAGCALAVLLPAAAPAFAAQAGWRQITVPGLPNAQAPIPVILYYPTEAAERSIAMGPYLAHVAPQAPPDAAFKGLIVISHGLGGSELAHESLAEALARRGYLVAALRHPGDNWQDHSLIARGPAAYLDERARHVSRVLDALLGDPQTVTTLPPSPSWTYAALIPLRANVHCRLRDAGISQILSLSNTDVRRQPCASQRIHSEKSAIRPI